MLSRNELMLIEKNYSIILDHNKIKPIPGGDVSLAYQIQSADNHYFIKKIKLDGYIQEFNATTEDIKKSLSFIETICKEQSRFGNVIPAMEGQAGVYLEANNSLFILFPYIEGKIIENKAITNEMIASISQRLYTIHHEKIIYDKAFSQKRNSYFLTAANLLIQHPLWPKLETTLSRLPFFPRIKKTIQFMADNKKEFLYSLQSMSLDVICHNDLKPKNVLWNTDKQYWIIDWEVACDFDQQVDYLDTLLAWCIEEEKGSLRINPEKVAAFQKAYYLFSYQMYDAMNVVIIKWYFWLYACLIKIVKNPTKFLNYWPNVSRALRYIELLITHRDLSFLAN